MTSRGSADSTTSAASMRRPERIRPWWTAPAAMSAGMAQRPASRSRAARSDSTRTVAPDGQEYLTRSEFVAITQALVGATAARFDDLERRQTETQTETAKLLFRALSTRQERQYNDLRTRLDLAALRQSRGGQTQPVRLEVPAGGGEGRDP